MLFSNYTQLIIDKKHIKVTSGMILQSHVTAVESDIVNVYILNVVHCLKRLVAYYAPHFVIFVTFNIMLSV